MKLTIIEHHNPTIHWPLTTIIVLTMIRGALLGAFLRPCARQELQNYLWSSKDSALAKWLKRGADGARLDVASEIGHSPRGAAAGVDLPNVRAISHDFNVVYCTLLDSGELLYYFTIDSGELWKSMKSPEISRNEKSKLSTNVFRYYANSSWNCMKTGACSAARDGGLDILSSITRAAHRHKKGSLVVGEVWAWPGRRVGWHQGSNQGINHAMG